MINLVFLNPVHHTWKEGLDLLSYYWLRILLRTLIWKRNLVKVRPSYCQVTTSKCWPIQKVLAEAHLFYYFLSPKTSDLCCSYAPEGSWLDYPLRDSVLVRSGFVAFLETLNRLLTLDCWRFNVLLLLQHNISSSSSTISCFDRRSIEFLIDLGRTRLIHFVAELWFSIRTLFISNHSFSWFTQPRLFNSSRQCIGLLQLHRIIEKVFNEIFSFILLSSPSFSEQLLLCYILFIFAIILGMCCWVLLKQNFIIKS